jgi:hypothetical protein
MALVACGGGAADGPTAVPDAPLNLAVTVAEQSLTMSWSPPAYDGGARVQSYKVTVASVTPDIGFTASVVTDSTSAMMEVTLREGVQYSITVRAQNSSGSGTAAQVGITPGAIAAASYQPLTIQGDDSPSGISDPSIIRLSTGQAWMAYSSNDYYQDEQGKLVQDVGIHLARSDDRGATFTFSSTIAAPQSATVTDTDSAQSTCGAPTCSGRWIYETPWLMQDDTDPDSSRRFKLFARQSFFTPGKTGTRSYLGTIVMWTAASPDGEWSEPTSILGSIFTPPELMPANLINTMHADLSDCVTVADGSGGTQSGSLDIAITCVYPGDVPLLSPPQKVVLLRTTDHAKTFRYISTLLTQRDADTFGPVHFTAPLLVYTADKTPLLIATPAAGASMYVGCSVFSMDAATGTVFRENDKPVRLFNLPPVDGHYGGACAWDSGLSGAGMLISDIALGANPVDTQFRILTTGRKL